MTTLALSPGIGVFPMAEEDKIRKLVDAVPRDRFTLLLETRQLLNRRAWALDGLVATHAVSRHRNLCQVTSHCSGMASIAFDSELAVLSVTERDRLHLSLGGDS